jgi:sphinganine-1-phosphate aldolase
MRTKLFILASFMYYRGYFSWFLFKNLLKRIPWVHQKLFENAKALEKSLETPYTNFNTLPEKGLTLKNILERTDCVKPQQSMNLVSGIIYNNNDEHFDALEKVFRKFRFTNPLHPDLFPEVREMEIDIINMTRDMFDGGKNVCGNVTSGGTESILLAVYTYREWARKNYGITSPNIVAFHSVHPAFDKACHYFGVSLRKVSSLLWMKLKMDWNTICVIGSAPTYGYGTVDPIREMAAFCYSRNTPFHVDCCMGGFLMPFLHGNPVSFKYKGITSISADSHKYGNCYKGSSILLFRDWKYKQHQHFVKTDWEGGMYATPTLLGSKSGALFATTWASMLLMGREKYTHIANTVQKQLLRIRHAFSENPDIDILGYPTVNIIAFSSKTLDIYKIVHFMERWNLSVLTNPPAFHFCITSVHTENTITEFMKDLNNAICQAREKQDEKLSGTLAIYGSAAKIENSLFTSDVVNQFIGMLSSKKIFSLI